ncbi:hypothetical protein P8C59_005121 [Phyllachora maydis]|uniref:TTI1 N-terminal TPR domain-containing protein n=1 Tax=Phyllachora maydis TaxID=1825666 RepID=A0AAD9I4W5_9PEZI|nr:hypothetical protein P8C59_005121 [Phyllachora maydis]
MTSTATPPRTEFFRKLKPLCVPLSQIVLRQDDTSGEAKEVLRLVLQLTEAWESQEREDASVLDDKLADYVFFPLSRVLAKQERYPVRVLESIVILLRRLIDYGWKAKLSAELAMQLLIFLALTAEGASSYETRREFPEEMILEAYRCMSALLAAASLSPVSWVGEHTAKAHPLDSTTLDEALGDALRGSLVAVLKLAAEMISYVRDTDGPEQLAAYWLSFELLKALYRRSSDLDSLVDLSSSSESQQQQMIFQELYNFSASTLASYPGVSDGDWRLEAVALEMTAFAASQLKSDFRPELIDVLYPMTTFLGAQRPQLRNHAFAALNSMAASCGYNSVSDLIVDNADYMVNSVSLRLNTFDIAPASVKVLTMLIRLTGPRLVPYLDDAIDAVFAALDNYHGYAASSQGNTGNILIAGRRPNDASSAAESEPLQLVRIDAAVAAPVQAQPPWTKGLVHADVGLGRFAQPAQIWDAAVDLAAALVRHVRIDDVMFDEILALVADELPARDPGVREALETVNADAVWLALCRRGLVPCPRAPERVALHGVMMEFPPMGQVG